MNLSVFIELSTGRTLRVSSLKKFIGYVAKFGYKVVYLGLTDAYKIVGEPYFNYNRPGYTSEELKDIDEYSKTLGVEVRVSIQTLAHLMYALQYKYYDDIKDTSDILLVGEDKTYEFIEKMIKTISESVSSRIIHLGMDEAFDLGKGKYKLLHGERNKQDIFTEHLNKVLTIAEKYGYKAEIWSDMFFRMVQGYDYENGGTVVPENIKNKVPQNITLCYWNYTVLDHDTLSKQIEMNKSVCDNVTFAGTIWKSFNFAPYNRISAEHVAQQIDICEKCGLKNYMVTLWTDNTLCDTFTTLPALFYIVEYNKNKEAPSIYAKKKFADITGVEYDDFMALDFLNDPYMKNIKTYSTISYMGFYCDLLYGYYDYFFNKEIAKQYKSLSEKYKAVTNDDFKNLFAIFSEYSEILSIKTTLGKEIRNNYKEKNLSKLKEITSLTLPALIEKLECFSNSYFNCWDENYYPHGCEVNLYYIGGLIARLKNIQNRINKFIIDGKPIDELEREELPPSDGFNIENVWYTEIKKLITFSKYY